MLDRFRSTFFILFAPIAFYITVPDGYRDVEWLSDDWLLLFFISLGVSVYLGEKIDSILQKKIKFPHLLPVFYALILISITIIFYIVSGSGGDFYLVSKIFFIFILSVIVLFFSKNVNEVNPSGEGFSASDESKRQAYIEKTVNIVRRQLQFVPKEVAKMEDVEKIVFVYAFNYLLELHNKNKFKDERNVYVAFGIILTKVFDADVEKIKKFTDFSTEILCDKKFENMPALIAATIDFPAENQTALLVFIERFVENKTGNKTRFKTS